MHNLHISNMRRLQVRGNHKQDGAGEAAAEQPSQMLRIEVRTVLAALAELPQAQRQAIPLIAIEDLKYEEAAKILDIPIGTLMSRLRSEEHTSELQSLMRTSYPVFCLQKK